MADRLLVRRLMLELHFAYVDPIAGGEAVVILDADLPDNMERNLGNLSPGTRRLLVALLESALDAARKAAADG